MSKKNNIFKTLLNYITYKEKIENRFYIPEIHEIKNDRNEPAKEQQNNSNPAAGGKKRKNEINKPVPAADWRKQKDTGSKSANSDNNDNNDSVSNDIEVNIKKIEQSFNIPENKDIIIRRLSIAVKHKAFIFYLDGMVDRITVNNSIIKPLLNNSKYSNTDDGCLLDFVFDSVIETNQLKKVQTQSEAISEVLTGNTAIYIDSCNCYIICETKGYEKRNVDKPQVEGVVKGSQEAFNENLRTNITLVRRILKNEALINEFIDIGKRSNNLCSIMYLKGVVNPALIAEVKRRINEVNTDFITGDGILEHFIEDNPLSIIPTILSTERPDRTVSHILEGKVAILVEGTPFALIVPIVLADLLHTSEDTSLRWQYGTMLRLVRLFSLFVAIFLPGLYVALTTFHKEMIPTELLIAIAQARENVPFPTIVEVIFMEIAFELIREAGIRIPGIIGNTIGIIGALILGQAAVQANLVSPVLIIIISFTGLGTFAIPDFSLSLGAIIMRLVFILLGAAFGFYGISLGFLASLSVLASLRSFGVPMLTVIAPRTKSSSDFILRKPVWKQEMRPDYLNTVDKRRQPEISKKWTKKKSATSKTDKSEE